MSLLADNWMLIFGYLSKKQLYHCLTVSRDVYKVTLSMQRYKLKSLSLCEYPNMTMNTLLTNCSFIKKLQIPDSVCSFAFKKELYRFNNLTHLTLSNNISNEDLSCFIPNLKCLDLQNNNSITDVKRFTNLTFLSLQHNDIISDDEICDMTHLRSLDLGYNYKRRHKKSYKP